MRIPRPGRARALAIALAGVLALAGCGGGDDGSHPNYERALAGSPPPLAALHEQANQLLPGGVEAYEKRIASLRGYPVLVNVWASWCGPCRYEFPTLQDLSARYGKRVAFLGINSEDADRDAAAFLEEEPVPYPSFSDGDGDLKASIGADRGLPVTAIYDRRGRLCRLKPGPYRDHAELEAELRAYALGGECEGA